MAERGIIFSAPMVLALLEGRKTQTRRLCKAAEKAGLSYVVALEEPGWFGDEEGEVKFRTPYAPGDLLWVRETWATHWANDNLKPIDIDPELWSVRYYADDFIRPAVPDGSCAELEQCRKKRVAIHMPRWASRLDLIVTEVRVRRLQDITEADCIAEGPRVKGWAQFGAQPGSLDGIMVHTEHDHVYATPRCWYRELWGKLHTKPGQRWDDNPWIVAYTFTVERRVPDAG